MKTPLCHPPCLCASVVPSRRATKRRPRGTAEIELLLILPLLVGILLLTWGAGKVAFSRLLVARTATYEAFQDATDNNPPLYAQPSALPDLGSIDPSLPPLPNRLHVPDPAQTVQVYAGPWAALPPLTIQRSATTISPPLAMSSFPDSADNTPMGAWFTAYADPATASIRQPLGLADPWRP